MRKLLFILLWPALTLGSSPVEKILSPQGVAPLSSYPLRAYSEYMPAPRAGVLPYEPRAGGVHEKDTRWEALFGGTKGSAFVVPLLDERIFLQPALSHLAKHWLPDLRQLEEGDNAGGSTLRGIPASLLQDNPFLVASEVKSAFPIVSLSSVTLSRSQDDEGKTPWTVYGGMDLVPNVDDETIFWRSLPAGQALAWWEKFLAAMKAGKSFHILSEKAVPKEVEDRLYKKGDTVRVLVTFQPASVWPKILREKFVAGKLFVIPHPSTLIFSGSPLHQALAKENPEALQLPLAQEFSQFAGFNGARVLRVRSLSDDERWRRRSHRFSKRKNQDREDWDAPEVSPFQMIFDAIPEVIGLYGKPVARNTQAWGVDGALKGKWILDGPRAGMEEIERARETILSDAGKTRFAFRDYYPPLQVNGFELRWYRPLVAWLSPKEKHANLFFDLKGLVRATRGKEEVWLTPVVSDDTGTDAELSQKVEFTAQDPQPLAMDGKKILEFASLLQKPLTEELASSLITSKYPAKKDPGGYAEWKERMAATVPTLVAKTSEVVKGRAELEPSLTYPHSVNAAYEKDYWKKISDLVEFYTAKNNVDCADHEVKDSHCEKNELPLVSRTILRKHYEALGLEVFEHTFQWELDFKIPWWGGLDKDKPHHNLVAVIPGTGDHKEAVIMADHYDTAYMGDVYEGKMGKEIEGHRHAAPGADDNHSATAALMEAARVLTKLKLKHDVWLVHLTGEEFPADCLGARALTQDLVTGKQVRPGHANPKIRGVYVLDMVAHNTDRDHVKLGEYSPSIYQIAPGRGENSAKLAEIAHQATLSWNALASAWDKKFGRKPFWERSLTKSPPRQGLFPRFRGEIRPWWHYRSALFNTDGQIFSDAGIPVVLFMENYDINREGYHDTKDTLANIDLDYGAGVTRIAIESVAQLAQ